MQGGVLDERGLRRTIAMLVALAALAERAATRSFAVRWFVLALLRYAERVARNVLVEETGWDWPDIEDAFGIDAACDAGTGFEDGYGGPLASSSGPADAQALAWRLRVLAALFRALLPPDETPGHADTRAGTVGASRGFASCFARLLDKPFSLAWPAPDTS